jgi:hypothetical protein
MSILSLSSIYQKGDGAWGRVDGQSGPFLTRNLELPGCLVYAGLKNKDEIEGRVHGRSRNSDSA